MYTTHCTCTYTCTILPPAFALLLVGHVHAEATTLHVVVRSVELCAYAWFRADAAVACKDSRLHTQQRCPPASA